MAAATVFRLPGRTIARLDRIGAGSIDDLFDEIPPALRIDALPGVPAALPEMDVARLAAARAEADGRPLNFIGAGAYEHHIPAAIWHVADRLMQDRDEWTHEEQVQLREDLQRITAGMERLSAAVIPDDDVAARLDALIAEVRTRWHGPAMAQGGEAAEHGDVLVVAHGSLIRLTVSELNGEAHPRVGNCEVVPVRTEALGAARLRDDASESTAP